MNRFSLLFVGLLSWLPGLQAASINSLAGSYTSLPVEWRELSLLHGAIALETGMLKRLYTIDGLSSPNKATRQLVRDIFYQIPNTEEFAVSKKILENTELSSTIIPNIIANIAVLGLLEKIRSSTLEKQYKDPTISRLKQQLKPIGNATSERFASAQTEIAIAILSGALWFIKKTMPEQNFEYQEQLTTQLQLIQEKILQPISKETARKTIESALQSSLNTTQNTTLSAEDYETKVKEILTQLAGMAQHPEHLNYQKATVLINEQPTESFSDCMETTMRNLFNILAYNPKTESLSVEHLQTNFPNARPELIKFYTKYPKFSKSQDTTGASQKDQAAYDAWAQLVSNLDGIKYNEPEINTKKTHNLEPSYPNLLMLTNYLLGLNWFDNLQQYPNNPDDFAQEHMAKFIELFDAADKPITELKEYGKLTINTRKGYAFTIDLGKGHGNMQYDQQNTNAPLQADNLPAYPQLYNLTSLAYWPKTPDSLWHLFSQPIENPDFCENLIIRLNSIPYSWINLLEDLIKRHRDRNEAESSVLSLYTKVIQTSVKTYPEEQKTRLFDNATAKATERIKEDHGDDIRPAVIDLLKALMQDYNAFDKIIDFTEKQEQKRALQVFTELVQNAQLLKDTQKDQLFDRAIAAVTKGRTNPYEYKARKLLEALIQHPEALDKLIDFTKKQEQKSTLKIFTELWFYALSLTHAQKAPLFNHAIAAATKGINEDNWDIKNAATYLLTELMQDYEAFDKIIDFIEKQEQGSTLKIFAEIVKHARLLKDTQKDQLFDHAIAAVTKGIKNSKAQDSTLKIFAELVKHDQLLKDTQKDQLFDHAIAAATEGMKNSEAQDSALQVFTELVQNAQLLKDTQKDQLFDHAIVAAIKGRTNPYEYRVGKLLEALIQHPEALDKLIDFTKKQEQKSTLQIFTALWRYYALSSTPTQKTPLFDHAITAATKGINEDNWDIKNAATSLLTELMQDYEAFHKIIDFIEKQEQGSTLKIFAEIVKNAEKLLSTQKNQLFDHAIDAATKGIKEYNDWNIRTAAIHLLEKLMQDKEAFNKIIDAAEKQEQKNALQIFTELVKNTQLLKYTQKNQLFDHAIAAATEGIKEYNNWDIRIAAIDLLTELIKNTESLTPTEKTVLFEKAIAAATEGMENSGAEQYEALNKLIDFTEKQEQDIALGFFTQLVKHAQLLKDTQKDQLFDHAIAAVTKGIKEYNDWNIRTAAIHLLEKLMQDKEAFNKIIDAAEKQKQDIALEFFTKLVKNAQALAPTQKALLFEKAKTAATEGMKNKNSQEVQKSAKYLSAELAQAEYSGEKSINTTTSKLLPGAAIFGALASGGYRWYTDSQRRTTTAQQNQPLAWPWNITTRPGSVGTPTTLPTPQPATATINTNPTAHLMAP